MFVILKNEIKDIYVLVVLCFFYSINLFINILFINSVSVILFFCLEYFYIFIILKDYSLKSRLNTDMIKLLFIVFHYYIIKEVNDRLTILITKIFGTIKSIIEFSKELEILNIV